ncbi:hypothetical protein Q1695_015613 [Nippostrongylus brasiliensis]|nr:hypothetical protein Q1695_015613 [Nippostrongylus brasiliensis]
MEGYNEGLSNTCKSYMRALSRASKMEDAETMRICSEVTGVGIITINSGALSAFRHAGLTVNLQAINRAMHEIQKVMSEPQTKDLKFEDSDSGHNDGRRTLSEVEAISEKTELEETEQEHTEEEEA